MNKLIIIGSINQDIVIKSNKIPKPGETVFGNQMHFFSGGKGANQAIAASNFGKDVTFFGKVGDDVFGNNLIKYFAKLNLNARIEKIKKESTGTAIINVDPSGENAITLVKGANDLFSEKDISILDNYQDSDYILLQNEINQDFNHLLIESASLKNMKVIVNPAPSYEMPLHIIKKCDTIIVNEHELQEVFRLENYSKIKDIKDVLFNLSKTYSINIILTLGSKGAVAVIEDELYINEGKKVNVVDTTGAGDCFCGVYTAAISRGKSPKEALRQANRAAAISVTRLGANFSFHKL